MGIPSYFSYIVKNHTNIIKRLNSKPVDNLYLDCNSIIYDVYNKLKVETLTEDISISIIKNVISKIEGYVQFIKPTKTLIIAFDGVAPVAKLEQQRSRRYKSWYQNQVSNTIYNKNTCDPWNTTAITPGTLFMQDLNRDISTYFNNHYCTEKNMNNIVFSGSDVPGEGEHKIFEYIRFEKHKHLNETTMIYGLDADLIMLSINHLPICPNIYLFRETPDFIKSIDNSLEPNADYYLDIPELTEAIVSYMNNNVELTSDCKKCKVYDYIFLCFFLGNDFLPHFPAINIRNGGINKLLDAYKNTMKPNDILTNGTQIFWNNLRKIVSYLAELEEDYLIEEHKKRDIFSKREYPQETSDQQYKHFELSPMYERHLERYIYPKRPNWRVRYYSSLFEFKLNNQKPNSSEIRKIATNYLEGLEWTMKYYTSGCIDWRWKYNYHYPPLLTDLLHLIPTNTTSSFIVSKTPNPVSELVQLSYVLPKTSLYLLPNSLSTKLLRMHPEWYNAECEFVWAYCKYFWESHVCLPPIDLKELETIITKHNT
jgi:5'-3' exoribonuclease 1